MKRAEYRVPNGEDVHPLLRPQQIGVEPDTKGKDGRTIKGKPIFQYRVVTTPEAETLDEFMQTIVAQDDPSGNTLKLAQGQVDVIRQRKIREFCESEECAAILDGTSKEHDVADLTEDERIEYALARAQEVGDAYVYGARTVSEGGANAQAKKLLAEKKALDAAAAQDPELAAKLAQLRKQQEELLASLGMAVA